MGKHRTSAEILAEVEAKAEALRVKVAQERLLDNPRMKSLHERKAEIKAERSKLNLDLHPEKGLVARIANYEEKIARAKQRLESSEKLMATLNKQEAEVNKDISTLTQELMGEAS